MRRRTPNWTKQEDNKLFEYANSSLILSKLPGRSLESVRKRARKFGFFLFQGTWTLQRICRETGYNWKQVQRAKEALNQKWHKESRNGRSRFIIDEEQVEKLTQYLKEEPTPFLKRARDGSMVPRRHWAQRFDHCVRCATQGNKTTQQHRGRGLCLLCYRKERRNSSMGR